jgi:uncharacterized protein (DUF2384 family)
MEQTNHPLFSNIAHTKISNFYTAEGDTNYREVASVFLKLSNDDLAKIASVSVKTVRFDEEKMPQALKDRIEEIKNVCELVADMLGGDLKKTQLWFTTKNQMLGNISPRDMIRFGRYNKLLDILMDIKNGNTP